MINGKKHLGELLDIPADALYGAEILHFTAGERLFVENHQGMRDYTPEYISVAAVGGLYAVRGEALTVELLTRDTLLITGKITLVSRDDPQTRRL